MPLALLVSTSRGCAADLPTERSLRYPPPCALVRAEAGCIVAGKLQDILAPRPPWRNHLQAALQKEKLKRRLTGQVCRVRHSLNLPRPQARAIHRSRPRTFGRPLV